MFMSIFVKYTTNTLSIPAPSSVHRSTRFILFYSNAFYSRVVNFKSNQIIFIGLRSSKDYYTRPGGGVGIWEGSLGCEFFAWVDVC